MSNLTEEVNLREEAQAQAGQKNYKQEMRRMCGIVIGVALYSVGVNMFLRPLNLYSGGFMGFAQLFNTILHRAAGTGVPDITGPLYYLMNLPALIIAYRTMHRKFVVKSIVTVTLMTVFLMIVPIPAEPILDERIANCLISGIMAGGGVGLVLRMGSCDGGMDLVGMILIQKRGNVSVGGVNTAANCILYGICLLLFDIPTVIYSLIYSVMLSMTCDHVHTQNINVQVLIITKMKDIKPLQIEIMGRMSRGMTQWDARGSYTGEEASILMTVISKYEIQQLTSIVRQFDPHAFVMMDEGVSVRGHFLKKLT